MEKLTRDQMKNLFGGLADEDAKPICTACTDDSSCGTGKVCRSSPSCIEAKVCAKPYIC